MTEKVGQPQWAKNIEVALRGIEEGIKISEATAESERIKKVERVSYESERKKMTNEAETYRKAYEAGYLIIDRVVRLPFSESAGLYLTKFFTTLRDEGKILANKCAKCGGVTFPPMVMCRYCKCRIDDVEKNWIELSDTGTLISYHILDIREIKRATGRIEGYPYPCAYIRLDGGDKWTILTHFLEERNWDKIHVGMRVQAVWKPRGERRGRMTDIRHFRAINE